MSIFTPVWFSAELPKVSMIDFIGRTPQEVYFFIMVDSYIYGMVMNADMIEYLTNEFTVRDLVILSKADVRKQLKPGCKIYGNQELIDF